MDIPRLGHHFELCFSVSDLNESIEFYKKIGFEIYTGGADQGWCTLKNDLVYLALFPDKFIEKEFGHPFLINFRGGNTKNSVGTLQKLGISFEKNKAREDGTGDAIFRDPDNIPIYLDTSPDEERIDVPQKGAY